MGGTVFNRPNTAVGRPRGTVSLRPLYPQGDTLERFLAKLPSLWRQGETRPTHAARVRGPRHWRTRQDPFDGVWSDVLVWLQAEPDATGKALMARLQSKHPDRFTEAQL